MLVAFSENCGPFGSKLLQVEPEDPKFIRIHRERCTYCRIKGIGNSGSILRQEEEEEEHDFILIYKETESILRREKNTWSYFNLHRKLMENREGCEGWMNDLACLEKIYRIKFDA